MEAPGRKVIAICLLIVPLGEPRNKALWSKFPDKGLDWPGPGHVVEKKVEQSQ